MKYRPLKNIIIEIKSAIATSRSLAYLIEREIRGDAQGNVTGATVEKDCPSAIREKLSIAHDIAAHNEKSMRDKMDIAKGLSANAKKLGIDSSAYDADYNKYKQARDTNIKNMGRLESIDSDYARKFKPSEDKYDQRAHALHLEKIQRRLEDRKKEAEGSSMPDYDRIEALDRRLGRVATAQKDSNAWLEKNDKNWLLVRDTAKIPTKTLIKDAEKKQSDAHKESQKAAAAAAKDVEKAANSKTPTADAAKAATDAAPAADAAKAGVAATKKKQEAERRRFDAAPGTVWKTTKGFAAKNMTGEVGSKVGTKYFTDEESAKNHAKGTGRKTKEPAAQLAAATTVKTSKTPKTPKSKKPKSLTNSFVATLVGNRLKMLSENKTKTPTKDMIVRDSSMTEAVQSIISSEFKKKSMQLDQVIEYDLDGKTLEEVVAFLDKENIDYCVKNGLIYVDDDADAVAENVNEEELTEVAARRKIVIRKGRKKIIFKCPPGKKKVGRSCMMRKASQRIKLSKAHRIGARKARSKRSRSNRLRKRSNMKRNSMGLNRRR